MITAPLASKPRKIGITGSQVATASVRDGTLPHKAFSFRKAREMRRDATIGLARRLATAPIIASSWSYRGDEKKAKWLKTQMEPIRSFFLYTALYGQIDFGWKAYEKIYDFSKTTEYGHRMVLRQLKALLNDTTWALYDAVNGDFIGFKHLDRFTHSEVFVPRSHAVFVNFDEEGVGNYGDAQLLSAERPYDDWLDVNDAARRYDRKMAGAHWIIHYPVGRSPYAANGGEMTDHAVIAQDMLNQLTSTGSFAIPHKVESMLDELNGSPPEPLWKIELIAASGGSTEFTERMRYLDANKIRGVGLLERGVIEGQYGTKAEAAEHANISLIGLQLQHEWVTKVAQQEIADALLEPNGFGAGSVEIIANPLSDEKYMLFKELFMAVMSAPEQASELMDSIDWSALEENLKIPMKMVGEPIVDSRVDV